MIIPNDFFGIYHIIGKSKPCDVLLLRRTGKTQFLAVGTDGVTMTIVRWDVGTLPNGLADHLFRINTEIIVPRLDMNLACEAAIAVKAPYFLVVPDAPGHAQVLVPGAVVIVATLQSSKLFDTWEEITTDIDAGALTFSELRTQDLQAACTTFDLLCGKKSCDVRIAGKGTLVFSVEIPPLLASVKMYVASARSKPQKTTPAEPLEDISHGLPRPPEPTGAFGSS